MFILYDVHGYEHNEIVRGVPTETLECKLFPAIDFCIEVPRGAEKGINIFKGSQACCA